MLLPTTRVLTPDLAMGGVAASMHVSLEVRVCACVFLCVLVFACVCLCLHVRACVCVCAHVCAHVCV